MGNVNLTNKQYQVIGGRLWRDIALNLSTNQILKMMRSSRWMFTQLQHEFIWQGICRRFSDYERLKFIKMSTGKSWIDVCKIRKTPVFKSYNGSKTYILGGDGNIHYSSGEPLCEYSDIIECKTAKKLSSFFNNKKEYACVIKKIPPNYFVNISYCSETVLFQSQYTVLALTASCDIPSRVQLANACINYVKAMDFGNFAIMDGIYFWINSPSIITSVHISQLDRFNITCIENNNEYCRMFYPEGYIDVAKSWFIQQYWKNVCPTRRPGKQNNKDNNFPVR